MKFIKQVRELKDLEDWRDYYVNLMFLIALILLPAGFLVSLPVLIHAENYAVIFMDVAITVLLAVFFIKPEIFPKRIILFTVLYTLLITYLVSMGPSYARPGWLIFSTVCASLIFGTPAAFITVSLNAVILSLLCFGNIFNLDAWISVYAEPLTARSMFVVNMSLLSLASSLPVSILLNRLNRSFYREKRLSEKLIKESAELHRINTSLEHEITERQRAEEAEKRLQSQLLEVQKMESIGRLAGGIAHDYNNMLSVILGNAEMMLADETFEYPKRGIVEEIIAAGNRSADLTRQLLAFARKQAAQPVPLDLNTTVTGMLKILKRLIGGSIKLEWLPGDFKWKVRIDPSQIDQILVNLAVNARDALGEKGQIRIETAGVIIDETESASLPESAPGEYVVLTVSDTGSGMDKETLLKVFEPFFTTKEEGCGTGLGLATVYGIVHQNSGFINVFSKPGQGTTFRIYLPVCGREEPA